MWADSLALAEPSFAYGDPVAAPWHQDFARGMDRVVDLLVGASPPPDNAKDAAHGRPAMHPTFAPQKEKA